MRSTRIHIAISPSPVTVSRPNGRVGNSVLLDVNQHFKIGMSRSDVGTCPGKRGDIVGMRVVQSSWYAVILKSRIEML